MYIDSVHSHSAEYFWKLKPGCPKETEGKRPAGSFAAGSFAAGNNGLCSSGFEELPSFGEAGGKSCHMSLLTVSALQHDLSP